ncbi:hypothetical protein ABB02_00574 [Clostridiaceae bacterium JG1575]|nr:hypothetical protein ABB02_00574 [Clostridiaceae bacterium JG1575]
MIEIGILGAASIAKNRFLPALEHVPNVRCRHLAVREESERSLAMAKEFGLHVTTGYESLIDNPEVDALYLPLPPALHFEAAMAALEAGKHVFLEKPLTLNGEEARILLKRAQKKNLVVHENYMFLYHRQWTKLQQVWQDLAPGPLRLIRSSFCFPKRGPNDFRYQKDLGGGALLDAGGYVARAALDLLEDPKVLSAESFVDPQYGVDTYGTFTLSGTKGELFQGFYGMDNAYQCTLELHGARALLTTDRIYTSPPEHEARAVSSSPKGQEEVSLGADNAFAQSLAHFCTLMDAPALRLKHHQTLLRQQALLDELRAASKGNKPCRK